MSKDRVGVAGYSLFRADLRVGSTARHSYTYASLGCGTSYLLGVRAYDAAGNRSARASIIVATTACPDAQPPTQPESVRQIAVTASSITLGWAAANDDLGVIGYEVLSDGSLAGSTATMQYGITGLACGTMYTLGVRAVDAAGNRSTTANVLMATSPCPDSTAPSSPGPLVMRGSSQTSVTVGWSASSDDVGVVGYQVYRDGASVGSTTTRDYTVSGLSCARSYRIEVDAYDAAGNRSGRSGRNVATQTCPSPVPPSPGDTTAPTAPTGVTVTSITSSSISVGWAASADSVGVTGYGLYRDGTAAGSSTLTNATFSGLVCGRSYQLAVDARDAAGNRSAQTGIVASTSPCSDTQPPSVPPGLVQAGATETTAWISWGSSTDNVGVAGYGVYVAGVRVGSTTSRTYTFTGLGCGATYTVGVDAYDGAGIRSARADLVVATSACLDTTPPSTPGGLTTSGLTASSVSLAWNASTDNVGVTGYGIYRGGVRIDSSSSRSYNFTGLACNTSYTLAVDAADASGNRSTKASTSVTTSACPPSGGGGGANAYLSPGGSDANACTQAAPCQSFNRGYLAVAPGGVVEVAAGSYPAQTIANDGTKTSSSDVVFRPAGAVVLGDLTVFADHLEVRDLTVSNSVTTKGSADDVTLRNVDMLGFVIGGSNISVVGGRVHCGTCNYHPQISAETAADPTPTNVLIDGVLFEDWQAASVAQHTECLQIGGGDGITIRNSTFRQCSTATPASATAAIHISWYGFGPVTRNVLLENNFIYASGNVFAIQANDFDNLDLKYNSIAGPVIVFNREGGGTGMDFVGNNMTFAFGGCTAENSGVPINWRYNVLSGGTCGSTDRNAPNGFIDRNTNLHLAPGSAAIDGGDPGNFPATDIDGNSRSGAPDAGADER